MTGIEEAEGPELVSLRLDEDLVAAVVRDADGDVALRLRSVDADRPVRGVQSYLSARSETRPWVTELAAGTVVFGELPDGSDRVEIRGGGQVGDVEVASGVYLARLDHRPAAAAEVYAVFFDRDGRIVAWPESNVLKRTPVVDAEVPCPACGALAWETIDVRTQPRDSHYRRRGIRCTLCGLQAGGWRPVGRRRPGAPELRMDPRTGSDAAADDDPVAAAPFPVYTLDSQLVEIAWVSGVDGLEADGPERVTISHVLAGGDATAVIAVSSSRQTDEDDDAMQRARNGLRGLLLEHEHEAQVTRERSEPARDLLFQQMHQQATAAAAQADQTTLDMPVGNSMIQFALVRDGPAWCAAGALEEINLMISGRDHDPTSLRLRDANGARKPLRQSQSRGQDG